MALSQHHDSFRAGRSRLSQEVRRGPACPMMWPRLAESMLLARLSSSTAEPWLSQELRLAQAWSWLVLLMRQAHSLLPELPQAACLLRPPPRAASLPPIAAEVRM